MSNQKSMKRNWWSVRYSPSEFEGCVKIRAEADDIDEFSLMQEALSSQSSIHMSEQKMGTDGARPRGNGQHFITQKMWRIKSEVGGITSPLNFPYPYMCPSLFFIISIACLARLSPTICRCLPRSIFNLIVLLPSIYYLVPSVQHPSEYGTANHVLCSINPMHCTVNVRMDFSAKLGNETGCGILGADNLPFPFVSNFASIMK